MSIRTIDPHESESIKKSSSKPLKTFAISKYVSKDLREILELDEREKENSKEKSKASELRKNKKHRILKDIMRKEELDIINSLNPKPVASEKSKVDSDPLSSLFDGCEIRKKELSPPKKTEIKDKVEVGGVSEEKVHENGKSIESVLLPFEKKVLPSQSRTNHFSRAGQGKAGIVKGDSRSFKSGDQENKFNNSSDKKSFQNFRSASAFQPKNDFPDSVLKNKPADQNSQKSFSDFSQSSVARCNSSSIKIPNKPYSKGPPASQVKNQNPPNFNKAGQKNDNLCKRRSYSIPSEADIRIEDLKKNETYKRQNFGEYRKDPSRPSDPDDSCNSSNCLQADGEACIIVKEIAGDGLTGRFKNNFKSDHKPSANKSENYSSCERRLQDKPMMRPPLLPDPDTESEKIPDHLVIDLTSDDDDLDARSLGPAPRNNYYPNYGRYRMDSRNRRNDWNCRKRNGKIGEDRRESSDNQSNLEIKKKFQSFKQKYNYIRDYKDKNAASGVSAISSDGSSDSNFTFNPYSKDAQNCVDNVGTMRGGNENQFKNSGNFLPCKRDFIIDVELEPQKFDKVNEFSNVANGYGQALSRESKNRSFIPASPIDLKSSQLRQTIKIPVRDYKKDNISPEANYMQEKPNFKFSSFKRH